MDEIKNVTTDIIGDAVTESLSATSDSSDAVIVVIKCICSFAAGVVTTVVGESLYKKHKAEKAARLEREKEVAEIDEACRKFNNGEDEPIQPEYAPDED